MSGRVLYSARRIAEKAGISQQMVSYVIKGDRQPSVEMAGKLEKVTGICREAWLWPERHFNPYIPFADIMTCVTCRNRLSRQKTIGKIVRQIYQETKDFDQMVNAIYEYYGIKEGEMDFRFREVKEDGMHLLSTPHPNRPTPKILKKESLGKHWDELMRDRYIILTWYPPGKKEAPLSGLLYPYYMGIHSGIQAVGSKRRLVYVVANFFSETKYTPDMIEKILDNVDKLEKLWLANQESA